MSTAASTSTTNLKITYTEPVTCVAAAGTQFSVTTAGVTTVGTTATCTALPSGSTTVNVTFPASTFTSGTAGTVTYTAGANPITDRVGNTAVTPQTISFSGFVADTTAPLSQDIRLTTNTNFNLDTGDVFTVAFNEVVVAPSLATIRLTDADGTIADVICGTALGVPATANATCTLNGTATTINAVSYPAGQVITVTMLAIPTVAGGATGTVGGLQIPATVTGSLLITDTAGNTWNIAGSPDKTLD
jgi:hypothetical protein